jgi:hypothetical protein
VGMLFVLLLLLWGAGLSRAGLVLELVSFCPFSPSLSSNWSLANVDIQSRWEVLLRLWCLDLFIWPRPLRTRELGLYVLSIPVVCDERLDLLKERDLEQGL